MLQNLSSLRRVELRKLMEELDTDIGVLLNAKPMTRQRIGETDGELNLLRQNRAQLQNQLAHIDALPDEILGEIWKHNLHDPKAGYRGNGFPIPSAVTMSSVTRRWRSVAIQMPSLWCDILLDQHQSIPLVKTQLERSKSRSLSVRVHIRTDPNESEDSFTENRRNLQELMTITSACIDRWRLFELRTLSRNGRQSRIYTKIILRSFTDTHAPRLEHLCIVHSSSNLMYRSPLSISGSPMLSHLQTQGIRTQIDWSISTRLTYLDLGADVGWLTPIKLHTVLCSSPLLTHLVLRGVCVNYRHTVAIDNPTIHVPSLRSLRLAESGKRFISNFFSAFSAPALRSLSLERFGRLPLVRFINVMTISPPSSRYPNLLELSLRDNIVHESEEDHALKLLQLFTSIKVLELGGTYTETFLQRLSHHDSKEPSPQPLCRHLHTVTWTDGHDSLEPVVRNFISDRISLGVPISKLRIPSSYSAKLQERTIEHVDVEFYDCGSEEGDVDKRE